MAEREQWKDGDPQASGTLFAVIVGAVLIFVITVALEVLYYRAEETERISKVYNVAPEELARLRNSQLERLNSYRLVDPAAGTVTIPIDRAMELVVRDQGRMPALPAAPKSAAVGGSAQTGAGTQLDSGTSQSNTGTQPNGTNSGGTKTGAAPETPPRPAGQP